MKSSPPGDERHTSQPVEAIFDYLLEQGLSRKVSRIPGTLVFQHRDTDGNFIDVLAFRRKLGGCSFVPALVLGQPFRSTRGAVQTVRLFRKSFGGDWGGGLYKLLKTGSLRMNQ
ncbi:hypothetical protein [Pseudomonas gregormendelii]